MKKEQTEERCAKQLDKYYIAAESKAIQWLQCKLGNWKTSCSYKLANIQHMTNAYLLHAVEHEDIALIFYNHLHHIFGIFSFNID